MKIREIEINGIRKGTIGIANTFFLRLRGMIGRRFESFDALYIAPCKDIHMLFMAYPIDAVFVNKEGSIVKIVQNLKPWALYAGAAKAHSVIELPAGKSQEWEMREGDKVHVEI